MTESEKFDLLLSKFQEVKDEVSGIKNEVQGMKTEMQGMKTEIQGMKTEIQGMKTEMQDMKQRITSLELHIENFTDKNVQLIAENFIELTNKLNQAIPAADKNLAYEVKVNYLINEITKLKKDVAELKDRTA